MLIAFASGLLFALGLGISGMSDPNNVHAFLDVGGQWDYSLALVMGGALAVFAPLYRAFGKPVDGLPTRIDARLVLGSAVFGVGWGLSGYCPGPALLSLANMQESALVFGAAFLLSAQLFQKIDKVRLRHHQSAPHGRHSPLSSSAIGPSDRTPSATS